MRPATKFLRRIAGVLRANLRHNDLASGASAAKSLSFSCPKRSSPTRHSTRRGCAAIAGLRIRRAIDAQRHREYRCRRARYGELSPKPMLMRADSGLYRAKRTGGTKSQVT